MIYLLYGSDTHKSREKLHELVASLIKKKPDASHIRITDEDFDDAKLDENIGGMGLFSQRTIVEMINVFRNKNAKESVMGRLKEIGASENIFVFLEESLLKPEKTKFEKYGEKIQEFEAKEEVVKKDFNVFSLTDALGRRDKKQLWVLYTKAKMKDVADEEIHGILFWQLKAMLQAMNARSAGEAGLNPFVYQKSQGFARNFTIDELKKTSSKLISIYHDARRGITDFSTGLEKFILEM